MKELYCPKDFPPVAYPHNHIALIYNQFPRRYSGGLPAMIKDLPRIAAMGFNVAWLNPIQRPTQYEASPTYKGSLYAMADDLLFNDDFFPGIPDHQERVKLVQEYTRTARALGIMPIFDLVLNHVGKETPLEKKFLAQDLLNTEPKNQWKDATFFDYADVEKRDKERVVIPNEQNQQKIIEQLWEPFVKRYMGTYGFTGVRADAVINVEPGLQAKVYQRIHVCCQEYHQSAPIVLGEFMAQDAYKHIHYLKGKGFTHIFAPATPYSRLLEYQPYPQAYYYNSARDKCDIDGVIEQANRLQEVASVAGILGNHDLAMLKAIVLLRLLGVPNEEIHAKFDRVESFLEKKGEEYKTANEKCDPQLKEWILRISSTCNGGYYLLAGDEYGLLKSPSVFDNHKEQQPVENNWGGNKDLRSYIKCVNYLLSQLPQATQGDKVCHEKRMVEGVALHIIWRKSAKDGQEYVICTSDVPLPHEKILQALNCKDKNIYFIHNNSNNDSQLFHYNPTQPSNGLQLIDLNRLILRQLLQQAIAQYHIGQAMQVAGDKKQAEQALNYARELINHAIKLDQQDPETYYYAGLIDLKLNAFELAKEKFSTVFKLSKDIQLLSATAEALLTLEETELAKSCCEKALELGKTTLDSVTALTFAKILLNSDRAEEAINWIDQSFKSINWKTTRNIDFLNELGGMAKKFELKEQALLCFKQAAEFDFDNPIAWLKLADAHFGLKQIAEMQNALYKAGLAYMALQQEDKAEPIFVNIITLASDNVELYNQLGILLRQIAEHKMDRAKNELINGNEQQAKLFEVAAGQANIQAEKAFKIANNLKNEDFLSLFHLGQLALKAGENKEAIYYLAFALKCQPKNISIKYIEQLGEAFLQLNLIEQAILCYKQIFDHYKIIADKKPDFFYPFYKMGNACLNLSNIQDAKDNLLKAFELAKEKGTEKMLILNNQLNYVDLADDLIKVGCIKEALRCYNEVDKHLADNYQYNLKLGNLYLNAPMEKLYYKKAATYFSKALKLYTQLPTERQNPQVLVLLYTKLGDARTQWARQENNLGMLKSALKAYQDAKQLLKKQDNTLERKIKELQSAISGEPVKKKEVIEELESNEDVGLVNIDSPVHTIETQAELFRQEGQKLIEQFPLINGMREGGRLVLAPSITGSEELTVTPDFFDELGKKIDVIAQNLQLSLTCRVENNNLVLYGEEHILIQFEEFLKAVGLTIYDAFTAQTGRDTYLVQEHKLQEEVSQADINIWDMRSKSIETYFLINDLQQYISEEDFNICLSTIAIKKDYITKLHGEKFFQLLGLFTNIKPNNTTERGTIQTIIDSLLKTRSRVFIAVYGEKLQEFLTKKNWDISDNLQKNSAPCLGKLIQSIREHKIEAILPIIQGANFKEEIASLNLPTYNALIIKLVKSFTEFHDHEAVQKCLDIMIQNKQDQFSTSNNKELIEFLQQNKFEFKLQNPSKSNVNIFQQTL